MMIPARPETSFAKLHQLRSLIEKGRTAKTIEQSCFNNPAILINLKRKFTPCGMESHRKEKQMGPCGRAGGQRP